MPRNKITLTPEQVEDALKNGGKTEKEKSDYLGVCEDVWRRERDRYEQIKIDSEQIKYITDRDPKLELSGMIDIDSFVKQCSEIYSRSRKTIGYNEVTVDLGDDDAVVKIDCDWHIGNEMTNIALWSEDIRLTKKTPRLFTILNGDYTDNLDALKKSGAYESIISVPEAKQKVKNAVSMLDKKVLGITQGCFLEGTPIVADNYTMKPIESIQKVLGSDKPYNVKQHWQNNYTKNGIYRISYLGNTVIEIPTTGNHPFVAIKRAKGKHAKEHEILPEIINAENLKPGDFVFIPKPKDPKGNKFTIDDMEIFGWYLAEGSALPERCMTVFSFGNKLLDKLASERIVQLIKKNHADKISSVNLSHRSERNFIQVIVYGRKFAEWIEKYCGRYSHSKKIHLDVINESNEKLEKLIDCFRLGDGHTRNSNGLDITLTTVSEDLAWQLWHVLLRIGQFASIRQQDKSKMSNHCNHNYDYFAINYRPNRKQFRFIENNEGYYVPITKIKFEEYEGEVKNLWIDSKEHRYRAGGLLVCNCHDEWFFNQDSWDISQYLADHCQGYWLGFRGIVNVILGEETYRFHVRHRYRRHSTDNLCWGMLYKFRKLKDPVDVMMSGHHHHPTVELAIERGQKVCLMMGGSYKPFDRFIEHRDIDPATSLMPAVYLRSDKHEITPFLDFRESIDYL